MTTAPKSQVPTDIQHGQQPNTQSLPSTAEIQVPTSSNSGEIREPSSLPALPSSSVNVQSSDHPAPSDVEMTSAIGMQLAETERELAEVDDLGNGTYPPSINPDTSPTTVEAAPIVELADSSETAPRSAAGSSDHPSDQQGSPGSSVPIEKAPQERLRGDPLHLSDEELTSLSGNEDENGRAPPGSAIQKQRARKPKRTYQSGRRQTAASSQKRAVTRSTVSQSSSVNSFTSTEPAIDVLQLADNRPRSPQTTQAGSSQGVNSTSGTAPSQLGHQDGSDTDMGHNGPSECEPVPMDIDGQDFAHEGLRPLLQWNEVLKDIVLPQTSGNDVPSELQDDSSPRPAEQLMKEQERNRTPTHGVIVSDKPSRSSYADYLPRAARSRRSSKT